MATYISLYLVIKHMKNKLKRKYFKIEQIQSRKEVGHNTNKIKEKKESDSKVSIRKDEIQNKN